MKVTVVTDKGALLELRSEWTQLLQASRANTIFLTWEWVTTWWEVYGRESQLYVLTARTNRGLVGIAPLKRTKRGVPGLWRHWSVEFIGQGGDVTPEYLDFFALPGLEDVVVDAFVDHLLADSSIAVVDLQTIPETSSTVPRIEARLAHRRTKFRKIPDAVCPVLDLPQSVEAFLATRSKNYLRKMGEYERRCERELHTTLRSCTTPDELRADMRALISLHHQRWGAASRAFRSPEYISFHDRLAQTLLERGWLRLFSLDNGDERLALLYCFAYNNRYYYYQAGRNPAHARHRLGLVLMHKVIQEAIRESATEFDFLRGGEDYKNRWATRRVGSLQIVLWKSLAARVVLALGSTVLRLRHAIEGIGQWRRGRAQVGVERRDERDGAMPSSQRFPLER